MIDPSTPSPAVGVAVLVVLTSVAGAAVFVGESSASLSTATAENVIAGMSDVNQTVTVLGQSTANGGTDYYEVRLGEIVTAGASVESVAFRNRGDDADAVPPGGTLTYHERNRTVAFTVREDPDDLDKKLDFAARIGLDTTGAISRSELRYDVVQYERPTADSPLSPQAAQFKLIGSSLLVARTSSENAGAHPVSHNASLTMPSRVRDVSHLAVNTTGANYGNLTATDVSLTIDGGPDLVTRRDPVVNPAGSGILIPLDEDTRFLKHADVRLSIGDARNPSRTRPMTVSFRTAPATTVFASTDELEIALECDLDSATLDRHRALGTWGALGFTLGTLVGVLAVLGVGRLRR